MQAFKFAPTRRILAFWPRSLFISWNKANIFSKHASTKQHIYGIERLFHDFNGFECFNYSETWEIEKEREREMYLARIPHYLSTQRSSTAPRWPTAPSSRSRSCPASTAGGSWSHPRQRRCGSTRDLHRRVPGSHPRSRTPRSPRDRPDKFWPPDYFWQGRSGSPPSPLWWFPRPQGSLENVQGNSYRSHSFWASGTLRSNKTLKGQCRHQNVFNSLAAVASLSWRPVEL